MSREMTRILLVEDNPMQAFLLQETLAAIGGAEFEVTPVTCLGDALRRLAEGGITVTLLDLSLPDSSELDTLRQVHGTAPEVAIVVLTGLDDEKLAVQAVQEGAQDYLVKGQVNGPSLRRAIRYAIERQRAETLIQKLNEELECRVIERTVQLEAAHKQLEDGIIERRLLESQLIQAQKLESMGQLAAGIAHEINTPIQYVSDNTRFLKDG